MRVINDMHASLPESTYAGRNRISDSENTLRQPICLDIAPQGSVCEWCGKPAEHQLTAPGGLDHQEYIFLCRHCGQEFVRTVASSLSREIPAEASLSV